MKERLTYWRESAPCPRCGSPIWALMEMTNGPPLAVRRYCDCDEREPVTVPTVWTYTGSDEVTTWERYPGYGTRFRATC